MECVVCTKVPIAEWQPHSKSEYFYGWHCYGHRDYFHLVEPASHRCCGGQGSGAKERPASSSVLSDDYDIDAILKE